MTSLPIKLSIIQSAGGAKGEFLAGWLGTLSDYLQNYWTVDCETGQSISNSNFFKSFPPTAKDTDLEQFLAGHNLHLDPSSLLWVSATTHDPHISRFFPDSKRNCLQLIRIDTALSDLVEIKWNWWVKTLFTKHRQLTDYDQNIKFGIDRFFDSTDNITDKDRIAKANAIMFSSLDDTSICADADVTFSYAEIFRPGGSRKVAESLELACSDQHHARWDVLIQQSDSPKIINRFGYTFRFDDFKRNLRI